MRWPLALLVAACAGVGACGDDTGTGGGGGAGAGGSGGGTSTSTDAPTGGGDPQSSPCRDAGSRLCERACECDPSTTCHVATADGTRISFDDLADCRGLYVDGLCRSGGSPKIDYGACFGDIELATCDDDASGVVIPVSCTES